MTTDWRALQKQAHTAFGKRVASVTDWSAPTPDAEWNVRALVAHVIEEQQWVPSLLAGRTAGEARARADRLGDDLAAEWRHHSAVALRAWDSTALSGRVSLSSDTVTAQQYLSEQVADVIVHTWDLSRATRTDERLDDALVDAAWSVFAPQKDTLEASGLFAAPEPIPQAASLQSRLLALTGRDDRLAA